MHALSKPARQIVLYADKQEKKPHEDSHLPLLQIT